MQKTPVSILQEMMVKKGKVPNYNLIHDGGGTHENTFTYEVSCEGLSAKGTGRCKKDAKHTAAKNMLEAIANHNALPALPASPAESPVRTPLPKPMPTPHILLPDEPFINAIGELQELCADNELADPVYETISDVGPPHARVFTIQCIVSNFKEVGKATTKKQAKHEAARKMFTRIKELVEYSGNSSIQMYVRKDDDPLKDINISELIHNKNYLQHKDLGIKLADRHLKLLKYEKDLCEDILKQLQDFTKDVQQWNAETDEYDNLSTQLKNILSPLNVDMQKIQIPIEDDMFMIAIYLNIPEISEISVGKDVNILIKNIFLRVIKDLEILLS